MKLLLSLLLSLSVSLVAAYGQTQKTEIMMLGTFHFNFPNLDVKIVERDDQIDVLEPQHQKEIKEIVNRLALFNPTIIVIEANPQDQSRIDSLYDRYVEGVHTLSRNERQQIGFRLGKMLGIEKLYCTDDWGRHYDHVRELLNNEDSREYAEFYNTFYNNPDSSLFYMPDPIFKTESILAELIRINDERDIKNHFGNYLIGPFKYATDENEFFGVDFITGWWLNRNLRIFRNIQKIDRKPDDKILVIYGAGHLNTLNYFFDCSPEFDLVDTNYYLKKSKQGNLSTP